MARAFPLLDEKVLTVSLAKVGTGLVSARQQERAMNRTPGLVICCALALYPAEEATAQVTMRDSRPPVVTAERESWYLSGTPITYAGHFYYLAGPRVHFMPSEMVRSGEFNGVPLYARTTIEPYSKVFVPVGGGLMQPYERRRDGELAGTVGSSAPSFPVALASDWGPDDATFGLQAAAPPRLAERAEDGQYGAPNPVGTDGDGAPDAMTPSLGELAARANFPRRVDSPNAIFVQYGNVRWFSSGPPVPYDPARFVSAGEKEGIPIYTDRAGNGSTIYVPILREGAGAVAPYSRRR
jgi:hypothetical protein